LCLSPVVLRGLVFPRILGFFGGGKPQRANPDQSELSLRRKSQTQVLANGGVKRT